MFTPDFTSFNLLRDQFPPCSCIIDHILHIVFHFSFVRFFADHIRHTFSGTHLPFFVFNGQIVQFRFSTADPIFVKVRTISRRIVPSLPAMTHDPPVLLRCCHAVINNTLHTLVPNCFFQNRNTWSRASNRWSLWRLPGCWKVKLFAFNLSRQWLLRRFFRVARSEDAFQGRIVETVPGVETAFRDLSGRLLIGQEFFAGRLEAFANFDVETTIRHFAVGPRVGVFQTVHVRERVRYHTSLVPYGVQFLAHGVAEGARSVKHAVFHAPFVLHPWNLNVRFAMTQVSVVNRGGFRFNAGLIRGPSNIVALTSGKVVKEHVIVICKCAIVE